MEHRKQRCIQIIIMAMDLSMHILLLYSFGPVFSNVPTVTIRDSQLVVSTFIVSKSGILIDSVFLYYRIDGSAFKPSASTANQYTKRI